MAGKKGFSPKMSQYYKLDGVQLTRVKKTCSRCGKGVYMSEHKDRYTCGRCYLTEFK